MQRILIRHTTGARSNQVDEFQSESLREILVGRDESASVRFDADREDLVSRNHARIYAEPAGSTCFYIADMQSRNGTFLNRQRISAPSRIHHGDAVQLGSGGPEFRLELDPAPAAASRPTRALSGSEASALAGIAARPTRAGTLPDLQGPRPIGRATVERMLDDTFGKVKRESGKTLWVGLAAVVMIALVSVGAYFYTRHAAAENAQRLADQRLLLLQMAQVVKQQPTADAAARAQMDKLSAEMKRIIAQNQALKQSQGQAQDQSPASDPAAAGAPGEAGDGGGAVSNYDSGLAQAENLYRANDFANAYAECVEISRLDPSRWEGYYIAGLSAEGLNKPGDALAAFQSALADAPDEAKATISARISAVQSSAAQAN